MPAAAVGIALVAIYVYDPPYMKRGINKVDWISITLLGIGLTALQLVLERWQDEDWFDSNFIIVMTVLTVITLTTLVFWELRT